MIATPMIAKIENNIFNFSHLRKKLYKKIIPQKKRKRHLLNAVHCINVYRIITIGDGFGNKK